MTMAIQITFIPMIPPYYEDFSLCNCQLLYQIYITIIYYTENHNSENSKQHFFLERESAIPGTTEEPQFEGVNGGDFKDTTHKEIKEIIAKDAGIVVFLRSNFGQNGNKF